MSPHLGAGLELILQARQEGGGFDCEGFAGLPTPFPAFVAIETDGSADALHVANNLQAALRSEILSLSSTTQAEQVPCGGNIGSFLACHALGVAPAQKLLVLVGDGTRSFAQPELGRWRSLMQSDPNCQAVCVLPLGSRPSSLSPLWLQRLQVAFWRNTIAEAVPHILRLAGVTSPASRLFITYIRSEATSLVDQLHQALSQANMDVFVDRFRVDPGVDFQDRLTEELADKTMVLVVESPSILKSRWTRYEMRFAMRFRLGLMALHLPGGTVVPDIDEAARERLRAGEIGGGPHGVLTAAALERVAQRIRRDHDRAMARRRQVLRDSMGQALDRLGHSHSVITGGLLHVRTAANEYHIHLCSRPPAVGDFHHCDTNAPAPTSAGIVIGPARFVRGPRRKQREWLADKSGIACYDEGQMVQLAKSLR